MTFNPFRLYRRYKRLQREALEEAQFLHRRYGDGALTALQERLSRPDLTHWGRKVLARSARLIKKKLPPKKKGGRSGERPPSIF